MIGEKLYWAFRAGDVGAGIPTGVGSELSTA